MDDPDDPVLRDAGWVTHPRRQLDLFSFGSFLIPQSPDRDLAVAGPAAVRKLLGQI